MCSRWCRKNAKSAIPGGIGPFSLMNYRQVKGWAKMIREVVQTNRMPPWGLEPGVGKWANDASLSDEQKAVIYDWVDNGTPQGNPDDAPAPLEFNDDWEIGEPDIVFEMPEEVTIPPTGVMPYQHYVIDTQFEEDVYAAALEVQPGNRKVVHHIIMFVQDPNEDVGDRGEFLGIGGNMLDVYAPGSPAGVLEPGRARFIPKGARLVWQMHYTPTGKEETDRSRFGIILAKEPVEEVIRTATIINSSFAIPPGDPNHRVEADMTLPADATIYSFTPHMHYRGKSMQFILQYPDGKEEVACSIPNYDFNWQLDYELAEPLKVPAGTTVKVVGHFDNSEANPYNPDPTKTVRWGEQTWEEMMMGGLFLSWEDEEVVMPTSSPVGD